MLPFRQSNSRIVFITSDASLFDHKAILFNALLLNTVGFHAKNRLAKDKQEKREDWNFKIMHFTNRGYAQFYACISTQL